LISASTKLFTGLTICTFSSVSVEATWKVTAWALAGAIVWSADTTAVCNCVGVTAFRVVMRLCPVAVAWDSRTSTVIV